MLRSHTAYAFGCKVTKLFLYSILQFDFLCIVPQKERHDGRPVRYNNVEEQRAGTEAEDAGYVSSLFVFTHLQPRNPFQNVKYRKIFGRR